MKVIRNIDKKVEDINQELLSDEQKENLLSHRKIMIGVCGLFATSDPNVAIEYFDIGKKIKDAKENLFLENAELKRLKEASEKNPTRLPAIFFAQITLAIRGAEDIDTATTLEVK
jgi:hypothetical protein